jgi:hypothetical protein
MLDSLESSWGLLGCSPEMLENSLDLLDYNSDLQENNYLAMQDCNYLVMPGCNVDYSVNNLVMMANNLDLPASNWERLVNMPDLKGCNLDCWANSLAMQVNNFCRRVLPIPRGCILEMLVSNLETMENTPVMTDCNWGWPDCILDWMVNMPDLRANRTAMSASTKAMSDCNWAMWDYNLDSLANNLVMSESMTETSDYS